METRYSEVRTDQMLTHSHWPVCWSGVVVGALSAIAAVILFGLIGIALGAHLVGPSRASLEWKTMAWGALIFNVCGAFFSFVVGGWVAGKIATLDRSEPAMLHGAIVWLVTIPLVIFLAAQGAANYMGGWYGGFAANNPAWDAGRAGVTTADLSNPAGVDTSRTVPGQAKLQSAADVDAARAARNAALGAVAALLLGLMGSVLGGWMASGEPMTLTHWRTREERLATACAAGG